MLTELSKQVHQNNKDKGFYDIPTSTLERLALIHSEVSEALEADRSDKFTKVNPRSVLGWADDDVFNLDFKDEIKDTFEDELADVIIRVLDLAGSKGIDIQSHVDAKIRYNKLRPYKHGKKY